MRTIIDVRETYEFAEDHVPGAINLPLSKLANDVSDLNSISKDKEIILYCRSGSRSNMAINLLKQLGYNKLVNGINAENVRHKYV